MLEKIKCTKIVLGKSTITSGDAYRITLSHNGKRCSFIFNDNFRNESNKIDFINALECDSNAYESTKNLNSFMVEFSYSYKNYTEAKKAFDECKKQYERFNKLFTPSEQEQLIEELNALEL